MSLFKSVEWRGGAKDPSQESNIVKIGSFDRICLRPADSTLLFFDLLKYRINPLFYYKR